MQQPVRIAPSILSADFARLGEEIRAIDEAGADWIHVDVMDGHFVPPITIGPVIVGALADQVHEAGGMLDVHLMIERPERQIDEFARAGADSISVHVEATPHVHYAVKAAREAGIKVIEVGALLSAAPDRGRFLSLDRVHMTEPYHRLMAKEWLKFLVRR